MQGFIEGIRGQTTDNTPLDMGAYIVPDDTTRVITLIAVARQLNGSGRACFRQTALVSRNAGTVVAGALGTQEKLTAGGATAWVATVVISGDSLIFRVTGENSKTISWVGRLEGVVA